MSNSRIIRPTTGNAMPSEDSLSYNFVHIEELSRQIIREAMERVDTFAAQQEQLEEEIAQRKAGMDEEFKAYRQELEADLEKARSEVDAIRDRAQKDGFEQGRKEAYDEGFQEGHQKGFAEGLEAGREAGHTEAHIKETERIQDETEFLVGTIHAFAFAISNGRSEMLQAARKELVHLAVKIAERILHREIKEDPDVIRTHITDALELAFNASKVTVQVHPLDAQMINKYVDGMLDSFSRFEEFEIVAIEGIDRGGCKILTGSGEVDLTLKTQLAQIQDQLSEIAQGEFTERIDGIASLDASQTVNDSEEEASNSEVEPSTESEIELEETS